MGKAYGKIYMTADGMLIARVWQRPAFSDRVEIIMEEYMRLEAGGDVIVDKQTCLHVSGVNVVWLGLSASVVPTAMTHNVQGRLHMSSPGAAWVGQHCNHWRVYT